MLDFWPSSSRAVTMAAYVSTNGVVRFGVFEADLRSGELRKGGTRVKIQELPFQALKVLISRPNEVLSREEIRQALWPDGVYVDFDRGVISAINRLRDALGDSAENPIFIETVGRRGYRWIAPTHSSEPPTADSETETEVVPERVNAPHRYRYRHWQLLLAVSVLVLLFAVWAFRNRHSFSNRPSSNRPSSGKMAAASSSAPRAANPEAEQ